MFQPLPQISRHRSAFAFPVPRPVGDALCYDRAQQGLFGWVTVIEGAFGNTGRLGNRVHARILIAGAKELLAGFEEDRAIYRRDARGGRAPGPATRGRLLARVAN